MEGEAAPAEAPTDTSAETGEEVDLADEDKVTATLPVDALELQKRTVEQLEALALFNRVIALKPIEPASEPGNSPSQTNAAGEADTSAPISEEDRAIQLAADELDANLVLVPLLRRHDTSYVELTAWWIPSWLSAIVLWWPTFFFPDERWASTVQLEWELRFVRTGRSVWRSASVPARTEASMDDFDRGWDLPGPYGIPLFPTSSWLGTEERNFRAVGDKLLPVSLANAEADMLAQFGGYIAETPIKPEGKRSRTRALVVGVDHPKEAPKDVPALSSAVRDAVAIADHLTSVKNLPARDVTLLSGAKATRSALEAFLNTEIRTFASKDRILIYFAGYGATDKAGVPYLVLHDTNPRELGPTAFPLDLLLSVLEEAEQRATIVLDTSFGGTGGRTLPESGPAPDPALFERSAMARRWRFLLTASAPDEPALEYEPEGHGLFTLVFLRGLKEGDEDQDGVVSLGELSAWTARRVPPAASVLGASQSPTLYAAERTDAALRLFGGARKQGE
jgi:hypothetical protein